MISQYWLLDKTTLSNLPKYWPTFKVKSQTLQSISIYVLFKKESFKIKKICITKQIVNVFKKLKKKQSKRLASHILEGNMLSILFNCFWLTASKNETRGRLKSWMCVNKVAKIRFCALKIVLRIIDFDLILFFELLSILMRTRTQLDWYAQKIGEIQ